MCLLLVVSDVSSSSSSSLERSSSEGFLSSSLGKCTATILSYFIQCLVFKLLLRPETYYWESLVSSGTSFTTLIIIVSIDLHMRADRLMVYMYCNYLVVVCLSKMAMIRKMWTREQNSSPSSNRTYFHEPPD